MHTAADTRFDQRLSARIGAGIAISIIVHAALLSMLRQPRTPSLPAAPADTLTVRLRPVEKAAPPPAARETPPAAQPEARARPAPRVRPPRRIIAIDPSARAPGAELPAAVDRDAGARDAEKEAPAASRFNMDAARSVARKVADEPDPAKKGTALERLPPKPYETETNIERAIKAAKRPACKDGVPGGLLAPIFLAMDKKDSGCKW